MPTDSYIAAGAQTDFNITFPYTSRSFVEVRVDDVLQVVVSDYEFIADGTIRFGTPMVGGEAVDISRNTDTSALLVDIVAGAAIAEDDLDQNFDQLLHAVQEIEDNFGANFVQSGGHWDAQGLRITNMADPAADQDAATKGDIAASVTAAAASAAAAAVDEAAADAARIAAQAAQTAAELAETNAEAAEATITGVFPVSGLATGNILVVDGSTSFDQRRARVEEYITVEALTGTSVPLELSGGYLEYVLVLENFRPTTNNDDLILRLSDNGTPTFYSGASDYAYGCHQTRPGANQNFNSTGDSGIDFVRNASNSRDGRCMRIIITPGDGTEPNVIHWDGDFAAGANDLHGIATGAGSLVPGTSAVRATYVELRTSSSWAAGTAKLYGVRS